MLSSRKASSSLVGSLMAPLGGSSGSPAGFPNISAMILSSSCCPSDGSISCKYPIGAEGCSLISALDVFAKTMSTVQSSCTVVALSLIHI